jgi:hypothetical protein
MSISLAHEEGMAESVIAKVLGVFKQANQPQDQERDELWYWARLKTLRADMKAEKLYPPGRVYWINGKDTGFFIDRQWTGTVIQRQVCAKVSLL